MKPYLLLFLLALFPFYAQAQTQTVTVSAGVPQPVNVSANYSGAAGQNSIFYYVCSAFASGSICQFSPAVAARTPGISALGAGNQVTINWAPGSVGATGYYVMRFATPGFSGQCSNCVVASNVSGTSYVDSSPSAPAVSFPPSGLNPVQQATGNIRLDNVAFNSPGLFWVLNGVAYPFALIPPGSTPGLCLVVANQPPFTATVNCSGLGGINQLHGDVVAGPGIGNQLATVTGLESVPFCTGYTPTNGQAVEYTTGGTPSPCYNAFTPAGGSIGGSGTINNLPKFTASTTIGNADLTDNASFTSVNAEPFSFNTKPGLQAFPNATAGTVVNTVSKLNGSAQVQQSTTADTNNLIGICTIGCGTTGTAHVSFLGQALCVFDGSANIRDYVQVSTTTGGDCTDAGNVEPRNGNQTIGRVLTTNSGAGTTALVDLFSPDTASHNGGSVSFEPPVTANAFVTDFSGTQIQTICATCTLDSLGNAVFAGSVTSATVTSTGGVNAQAGDVDASGALNAGVGGSTPTAIHFTDTSQAHDTVYNAPSSGYTGTVQMPAAAPTAAGQALIATTPGSAAVTAWGSPSTKPRVIGATFSGGGVQATQVYCCITVPNAGTIVGWDIIVDDGTGSGTCSSCTATIKYWRLATGTSTPTSANSINTSGVSLSTGTAVHSTTVTDFTSTAIAANDIIAVQLSAVANASVVTVDFQYQ